MKFTKILVQIAALYVFYMVGTWVQEMLNIPIPGSLIGMFLLLVLLSLKVLPVKWFDLGAENTRCYYAVFINSANAWPNELRCFFYE